MKEEDVIKILASVVSVLKDTVSSQVHSIHKDEKEKIPEFNKIYLSSIEMRRTIGWHADFGTYPKELFETLAPNQTDLERDYIKDTYEQNTLPVWAKGTSVVNRIFNEQNYSLTFKEDDSVFKDESAQDYFRKDYPISGDIIKYWEQTYSPEKAKDPNALAVAVPKEVPEEDTRLIEPVVKIYGAQKVIKFHKDLFALVLTDMKSEVIDENDKKVKEGKVFELFDTQYIWRITQIGKKKDLKFEIEIWFEHNLGFLPARKLKGEPIVIENEVLFKSYFYNAVPLLNQALYDSSVLQLSKVSHAFLEKWELFEKCEYKDEHGNYCDHGRIFREGSYTECPECRGTGRDNPSGPLKTKFVKLPDQMLDGEFIKPPYAGFVDRPIDILKFLEESIEKNEVKAFMNLNIDITDTPNGQTATESKLDREELFNFLLRYSNEVWDDLDFFLGALGNMRYGDKYQGHTLQKPQEFSIRSVGELTLELNTNIPAIAKREINNEILHTRFSTEADTVRIEKLKQTIDRLYDLDDLTIQGRKAIGTVANWEVILHDGFYSFVQFAMKEKEGFLDQDLDIKKTDLEQRAQNKANELAEQRAGSPDDILKKIANGTGG